MYPSSSTYTRERPRQNTVLLVEDELFIREATRSILENAGFRVLPAEDALVAMRLFEESKWHVDLVMTDMVLPGRTGQELGEDVRRRSPEIRVLITSGYGNAEYATEEPGSHMYFLAKPYSRRELLEKVGEILEIVPACGAVTRAG
jgi:DNA-binding NtrC family response regulator